MRFVDELEFSEVLCERLAIIECPLFVTGPGRSGAVASVYASHFLGVPFVPYKCRVESKGALIVDTAMASGRTVRKASRVYNNSPWIVAFNQPPRVKFWYERLSFFHGKGNEFRVPA